MRERQQGDPEASWKLSWMIGRQAPSENGMERTCCRRSAQRLPSWEGGVAAWNDGLCELRSVLQGSILGMGWVTLSGRQGWMMVRHTAEPRLEEKVR